MTEKTEKYILVFDFHNHNKQIVRVVLHYNNTDSLFHEVLVGGVGGGGCKAACRGSGRVVRLKWSPPRLRFGIECAENRLSHQLTWLVFSCELSSTSAADLHSYRRSVYPLWLVVNIDPLRCFSWESLKKHSCSFHSDQHRRV